MLEKLLNELNIKDEMRHLYSLNENGGLIVPTPKELYDNGFITKDDYGYIEWKRNEDESFKVHRRISLLKSKLRDTDYAVIKIAEGGATAEEYAEVIAQRQVWREEINQIENSVD